MCLTSMDIHTPLTFPSKLHPSTLPPTLPPHTNHLEVAIRHELGVVRIPCLNAPGLGFIAAPVPFREDLGVRGGKALDSGSTSSSAG